MEIMEIPDKIIGERLPQYLSWNDLLRLRRVNKWALGLINTYLKDHPDRAPEIEINEGKEKTFDTFTALGIPTTKIFINNPSGAIIYENDPEKMEDFLKDYGPLIKHLRVAKITLGPTGKELQFLENLPNLQSFEANCFIFEKDVATTPEKALEVATQAMKDPHCVFMNRAFPSTFKNLRSLRIGQDREDKPIQKIALTGELMLHCPYLKFISMPFTWTFVKPVNGMDMRGTLPGDMNFLSQYISQRPNDIFEITAEGPLEVYDFENYHDDYGEWDFEDAKAALPENWYGSLFFLEICEKALKSGLKLKNVNPLWYSAAFGKGGVYAKPEMGRPVVSLMGIDPIIMGLDMPNLEKVTIPWTTRSVMGLFQRKQSGPNSKVPKWPNLKILEITVNDNRGFCWNLGGKRNHLEMGIYFDRFTTEVTNHIFWFFFEGAGVRMGLEELRLDFVKSKRELACLVKEIPVPTTEMIVQACPNLKRIRLGNWLGKNKQLLKLWKGLERLEEVVLEGGRDFGDETFFGDDLRSPAFLKLKNLRKLSLIGMDQMPKVTDMLFSKVISQMKLTELVLTSDKPLKKVTKDGINALLKGPFKETIEKFPFQGWSLADVSAEEFAELGKKFRSYDML